MIPLCSISFSASSTTLSRASIEHHIIALSFLWQQGDRKQALSFISIRIKTDYTQVSVDIGRDLIGWYLSLIGWYLFPIGW